MGFSYLHCAYPPVSRFTLRTHAALPVSGLPQRHGVVFLLPSLADGYDPPMRRCDRREQRGRRRCFHSREYPTRIDYTFPSSTYERRGRLERERGCKPSALIDRVIL